MNGSEYRESYIKALNTLLSLIEGANRSIAVAEKYNSPLEVRQYQHLRKDYLKQLSEMMERIPDSMKLEVIEHV